MRARLAIITTSFPELRSGQEAAGSFVADFARVLARHVEVTVFAPGRQNEHVREESLKIARFAVPKQPLSLLKPSDIRHWPDIFRTLRSGSKSTCSAISAQFDHTLACWTLPSGYWAGKIKQRYGIPYSCWALGSDIWSLSHVPVVRNVLISTLRGAHTCFADGYQLKDEVTRLAGCPCHFLPSTRQLPKRPAKNAARKPPYKLAFLGRWHYNKGVDLLLEALEQLSADEWSMISEFRICGGGPLEQSVLSACREMQCRGLPVIQQGYLDKEAAADLLYSCDYLVIPSRIESIPVIFSDALQAGCPLIATPVGDLPMLFQQHRVGILAAGADAEQIRNAIARALASPPAEFQSGLQSARDLFDLEHAARKLLDTIGLW